MTDVNVANFQNWLQMVVDLRSRASDALKVTSEGTEGNEKKFLSEIKLMLDTINSQVKDLENKVSPASTTDNRLPLGHSVYLSLDVPSESTSLYNSLASTYQWFDKTKDYASEAGPMLSQNNLSRSYGRVSRSRRRLITGHSTSVKDVDKCINQVSNLFSKKMTFHVERPNGSQLKAIIHITLSRVLKAVLVLKGLVIEWVVVRGYNEEGTGDSETDVWRESDFEVFRKITENANAAMLNFHAPLYPELGIKTFVTFLNSYENLFTDKCRKCGYHLRNNLPPTWREFKTLIPYHEDCKP